MSETKRTDGMKRGRRFTTSPAANSITELEQLAMDGAREFFGDGVQLEMEEGHSTTQRWSNLLTGEPADPRYRGNISVYELVPDNEPAPRRHRPERNMPGLADITAQALIATARTATDRAQALVNGDADDQDQARAEAIVAGRLVQVASMIREAVHA